MAATNLLCNASAYLKKSFLICGIKPHLICRMTPRQSESRIDALASNRIEYVFSQIPL